MMNLQTIPDTVVGVLPHSNLPTRISPITPDEWDLIQEEADTWIDDGGDPECWRDRFLTYHFVLLLAATGVDADWLIAARWNDLQIDSVLIRNTIPRVRRAKAGDSLICADKDAESCLDRIYNLRRSELKRTPYVHELIFCERDGSPIMSFQDQFRDLVEYLDIKTLRADGEITLASLLPMNCFWYVHFANALGVLEGQTIDADWGKTIDFTPV